MGFLSPWMLWALGALAVPLWLHLRRRRRHQPIEFSSLRYLRVAAARVRRQARWEDLPLLLARCLLVVLLGMAVARPVTRARGGWLGHGRAVEAVVVLDATASMGAREAGGTRFAQVKRMAREWIESLDARDEVALWVVGDRLERVVPLPTGDRRVVLSALDAAEAGDGSVSLAGVFGAAREWAAVPGKGRKELVVFSDNQRAAWDWPAERFFREDWDRDAVAVAVMGPETVGISNNSIDAVEWHVREARPERRVSATARISGAGPAVSSEVVEVRVAGEVVCRKVVEAGAGGSSEVALEFVAPAGGAAWLAGEVALAGDGYGGDDHWWFALPVRGTPRVLVLDAEAAYAGAMRSSWFLTRALAAGRGAEVETAGPGEWAGRDLTGIRAVFATGSGLADEAAWGKLRSFAAGGGTVVVFGDGEDRGGWAGWPVGGGGELAFPAGRIATRILVPGHPLFEGVWSEKVPFPPLSQRTARRCAAAEGAGVLVTMAGELPFLVERREGSGAVYWLNAAADRSWGDLPLSPAWVPLVQQLARGVGGPRRGEMVRMVGEAWPGLADRGMEWAGGERITEAGLHEARRGGEVVAVCAANVAREESDLKSLTAAELERWLPGQVGIGSEGLRAWRDEIGREVPLWPWLLAAGAMVFAFEAWWSARVGQRQALRLAGGVADPARPGISRRRVKA